MKTNSSGNCDAERKRRIGIAKEAFDRLGKILKHQKISLSTRMRVLQCYVIPTLLFGCECWTMPAEIAKRLGDAEM